MTKNNSPKKKKSARILSAICTVLTVVFLILAAYIFINVIIAKAQNKPVNLFGVSVAVVLTDSMEPEIMTGDLITFRFCDVSEVEVGDNIVFTAGNGFSEYVRGKSVVHKAIAVTEYGIQTKGVNNWSADTDLVTEDNFLGICTSHSSFLGAVFSFLTKYGILIIVAVIGIPFIVSQIVKIVKLSKSREDKSESDASVSADGGAVLPDRAEVRSASVDNAPSNAETGDLFEEKNARRDVRPSDGDNQE